jgi:hypothetical protein
MIISLFMDETPLLSGDGDTRGQRAGGSPSEEERHRREREDDEHGLDVDHVHVSVAPKKRRSPIAVRASNQVLEVYRPPDVPARPWRA